MNTYFRQLSNLHSRESNKRRSVQPEDAPCIELLAQELELMLRFKMGAKITPGNIKAAQEIQSDILLRKFEIDAALQRRAVKADVYAQEVNGLAMQFIREVATSIGTDRETEMLGVSPTEEFRLVDPNILERVSGSG